MKLYNTLTKKVDDFVPNDGNNVKKLIKEAKYNKELKVNEHCQKMLKLIKNLESNQIFHLEVFADYDLEDGKSVMKDQKLGEIDFTTIPAFSNSSALLDFIPSIRNAKSLHCALLLLYSLSNSSQSSLSVFPIC